LRDVTATVDSGPLIAASIMSKKIAAGAKFLLLDVKVGRGAFMRDAASASELARTMVGLGERAGLKVASRLTAMDVPLGFTAGNALEVEESVEILAGGGPADVRRLVETFAADLAEMSGLDASRVRDVLVNGAAMDVWRRMVRAQGGDPDARLPRARFVEEVRSPGSGVLVDLDALQVGLAAHLLGAGRSQRDDVVDPTAGVRWRRRPGDAVVRGEVLFELHTSDASRIAPARDALVQAFTVGSTASVSPLLIDGV
jgi:thymidine phosphorylase